MRHSKETIPLSLAMVINGPLFLSFFLISLNSADTPFSRSIFVCMHSGLGWFMSLSKFWLLSSPLLMVHNENWVGLCTGITDRLGWDDHAKIARAWDNAPSRDYIGNELGTIKWPHRNCKRTLISHPETETELAIAAGVPRDSLM